MNAALNLDTLKRLQAAGSATPEEIAQIKKMEAELLVQEQPKTEEIPPVPVAEETVTLSVGNVQQVEASSSTLPMELQSLMEAKQKVREQVLPSFSDQAVADFQLVASVAESFAENRTHTLVYEVIPEFQNQIQLANSLLSFRSITTDMISGLKLKGLQDKAKWSTVSVAYKEKQGLGNKRNAGDDQENKIGSYNIVTTADLKY